jgi:hypothetical protein
LVVALAVLPFLGVGCGGITATRSISPLDFLLPGGFLLKVDPPPTNQFVVPSETEKQLAFAQ